MTELEPSPNQLEIVKRGRDMARSIQGNLARRLYRSKDATELQDASDLLWGLANVLADYSEAADYWQRMFEETMRERTCEWTLEHSGILYDKWRCSECGYLFVESRTDNGIKEDFDPNYCPKCGARVVEGETK